MVPQRPEDVEESQQYLRHFSRIAAEEPTPGVVDVARIVEADPDWENLRPLWQCLRPAVALAHTRRRPQPPARRPGAGAAPTQGSQACDATDATGQAGSAPHKFARP